MKKQKTQVIILAALMGVLAVAAYFTVGPGKRVPAKAPVRPTAAAAGSASAASATAAASAPMSQRELGNLSSWLAPNDTPPVVVPSRATLGLSGGKLPGLKTEAGAQKMATAPALQGILLVNGKRVAIIANQTYAVGQHIASTDYTVAVVEPTRARLRSSDGQELVLNLVK